jgi:6-phosphogluconolactonase (cycloisomerase 2 family)
MSRPQNMPTFSLTASEVPALNMAALNNLGEPDPANITKQDLLQSIAFDKQGQFLSVGDRGGRVIVFQKIEEDDGSTDFDYLSEF